MVATIIDELAEDYLWQTKCKLQPISRGTIPDYAYPDPYDIQSGQLVDQKIGAIPKQVLENDLTKLL